MSQRIVDFVAELLPLYTYQHADGHDCALCLADGTLIMPLDESHAESEEGWVAVFWQGDSRRRSEVLGSLLAAQAILRHVELHGIGRPQEELAAQRFYWCERFRQQTGRNVAVKPA
ncbi:hypothetical protein ASG87_17445 [Frateuria sp. Soil773]|nr:hypothetical protein ASG87_17445 [Frateuria sp. Soil773]